MIYVLAAAMTFAMLIATLLLKMVSKRIVHCQSVKRLAAPCQKRLPMLVWVTGKAFAMIQSAPISTK